MKKTKLSIALIIGIMLCLFIPNQVQAAPDVINKDRFDYTWYLQQHPDLAVIFTPEQKEEIYNFYISTGEPNGWIGRASVESYLNENTMDYNRFLNEHPDVLAAFGNNPSAIWNFYVTLGKDAGYKAYTNNERTNAKIEIYSLADSLTANCNSDWEKVKVIHDWIVNTTSYDYDNYLNNSIPSSSYYQEGVIFHHTAVCNGYALTFESFMDVLGIPCYKVDSSTHAWNRVKVNGVWYSIDTTWDDPIYRYNGVRQEICSDKYFLIGEDAMNSVEDHTPTKYSLNLKAKYEK